MAEEDGPTQKLEDTSFEIEDETEDDDEEAWGKLVALSKCFTNFNLCDDEYTFGRDVDCDYNLNSQHGSTDSHEKMVKLYSKLQFRITKNTTGGVPVVFIQDKSANGTFLDGVKIGTGNTKQLNSGAVISLAMSQNRAFLFKERCADKIAFELPFEFAVKYTMSKELGRGACGTVRMCFSKDYTESFAVKIIEKKVLRPDAVDGMADDWDRKEVEILRKIDHPNVVKIFDVFENPERVFIVLELVKGGDLFPWIEKMKKIKGPERCVHIKRLAAQMVLAVKYLHEHGITHRDLKPENILISGEFPDLIVKITDFGLSKLLTEETMLKTFCGTPTYIAPEILLGTSYTKSVDCWSLGVVFFVLLAAYPPFSKDYKDLTLQQQILQARYIVYKDSWKGIDQAAQNLVFGLLAKETSDRLTIDQVWNHEWFRDPSLDEHLRRIILSLILPAREPVGLDSVPVTNGKRTRDRAFSASPPTADDKKLCANGK